ncbi:MAG: HAMP domain-containing histidine kinase [Oscillospiraceae bacterium]|nr:HAMP domain-containing histidine kinase [Oscillospiraceae bacterium]
MKNKIKSLKFQNWLYLMIFSVSILAVLWILQIVFFNSFYKSMKTREIVSLGDAIVSGYDSNILEYYRLMNEYAFRSNLRIMLFSESGIVNAVFDGFEQSEHSRAITIPRDELLGIMVKISEMPENSDKIYYLNKDAGGRLSQAVYIGKVADGRNIFYVYVSSPIPPVDSTVSVIKSQFGIIIVILFVLSLISAQLISKKLAGPIVKLTKSAENLAAGNFEAGFYSGGYTEARELASALGYAASELSKLDSYRKEFIANVSHDLKTPLTIIKFYGELIRDVNGGDENKRGANCETIIKEADRLTDMVNEVLELSKLNSGNVTLVKTNINLSLCLAEVLESFYALTERGGYVFGADIDENIAVDGNEQYLKRVFYNLISNAVNYTGEDKSVNVSLKQINGAARFEVADTGEGIPPERLQGIWERYYKSSGKTTHKRAVTGTGIGLSIVKNALELHGARYGVMSEVGKGSTFWFELRVES